MIDSVVGLVEEHVDLGGSQLSESILVRWYFACASHLTLGIHGVALTSKDHLPPVPPLHL